MGPFTFVGNILAAAMLAGHICHALPADPVTVPTAQATPENTSPVTATQKPIYAIAHRVLTTGGVRDAVKHGANAIEIDFCSLKDGWWADHDCTGVRSSTGDRAEDMLKTIAEEVKKGAAVRFVWFDFKAVDSCDPDSPDWRYCSVAAMMDLARTHLEPAGIRVLYGFYGKNIGGKAYNHVRSGLNSNEAINVNGKAADVQKELNGIPRQQSVMSYGYFNLPFQFSSTLSELRQATQSGAYGKVFGWTLANHNNKNIVKDLFGDGGVDGLIYGFKAAYYYDHQDTRQAIGDIKSWVDNNSQSHRLANAGDVPW